MFAVFTFELMCSSNDSWPSKVTPMSFSVAASARGCFCYSAITKSLTVRLFSCSHVKPYIYQG